MKVCIVGAGAIGAFIGTRLAQAGQCELTAIARGATLAALREHGWRLELDGRTLRRPARVSSDPADCGPQDLVVVAVKGPALAAVAPLVAALSTDSTVVLPAMNGVPWWFGRGTPLGDIPLASIDPDGAIAAAIPFERVLGCVVHASTSSPEPGLVRHARGHGLIVGEPGGGASARAGRVAGLLADAGFETTVSSDIRSDLWYKLWGNLTVNPIAAFTGATVDRILDDPLVRDFCSGAMREAAAVGEQLGCPIGQTPEDRHAITARLGAFRPSMLQDVDAGRAIELDAIAGAVVEIARRLGIATPCIDAIFGLCRVFGRVRGLYPEPPADRVDPLGNPSVPGEDAASLSTSDPPPR